jgi:hypothetical protein
MIDAQHTPFLKEPLITKIVVTQTLRRRNLDDLKGRSRRSSS